DRRAARDIAHPSRHYAVIVAFYPFAVSSFFFYCSRAHRDLHSFPTRRSSDLALVPLDASPGFDVTIASPGEMAVAHPVSPASNRSEEHTSELQSRGHLVCRLLLEKKNSDRTGRQRSTVVPNEPRSAILAPHRV